MSYRGGEAGHFWPKLAGWFLVPAASGVATLVLAPLVVKAKDSADEQTKAAMTLSAVCHALGAAGSWYVSGHMFQNSIGTQAFFRGGMWSEMVSTLLIGSAGIATKQLDKVPAVSGLDPKKNIEQMLALLTGGVSQKLSKPRLYNQLAR